jgi:hypothetical protein
LDANEFQRTDFTPIVFLFQASLDRLASSLQEGVEVLRLRVAASEAGDCGHVVAVLVPFNDDSKFARTLHRPNLA